MVVGDQMHQLAIEAIDTAVRGIAQAPGILHDRLEDGLHIGLRTTDDGQDLARCGLPGEGDGKFLVPRLELLEQADVLDGNHGLVGEGLEQRDL